MVEDLGEYNGFGNFMQCAISVDMYGVIGLNLRYPLDKARAGGTRQIHHVCYGQRRGIWRIVITLSTADTLLVGLLSLDNMRQSITNGAKGT